MRPLLKLYAILTEILSQKIPLLVHGVSSFSNANIIVLDRLIAETKTDLKSVSDLKLLSSPVLKPVLY
jgi:hypothetical protein